MNKKELLELCDNSGAKLKDKVIDAICEYNKDIFIMEPDDWISVFKQYKMQKGYISELRREISKIYKYAIMAEKVSYNPFDSLELTVDRISAQINAQIYISQIELDKAVRSLNDDLVGGCIPQMIYEGAKSYLDIFNLNIEDIDFKNAIIKYDGYFVNASPKLVSYLRAYIENTVYRVPHSTSKTEFREFKMENVRANSFVKIVAYGHSVNKYKNFMNSCTNILRQLGFTKQQLYSSGFLNFLYKKCDYSVEELESLVLGQKNSKSIKEKLDRLNNYADEYGFTGKTVSLRYYMKDYCVSFILQTCAI